MHVYVRACVRAFVRRHAHAHAHTHTHILSTHFTLKPLISVSDVITHGAIMN